MKPLLKLIPMALFTLALLVDPKGSFLHAQTPVYCGDGACELYENSVNCYEDCSCGDGICDESLEACQGTFCIPRYCYIFFYRFECGEDCIDFGCSDCGPCGGTYPTPCPEGQCCGTNCASECGNGTCEYMQGECDPNCPQDCSGVDCR